MEFPSGANRIVSHYELYEELGRGGMGQVYRARDLKLDRVVALKFLAAHLLQSPEALARFQREAKLISSLNHPNIATVHAIDQHEGVPFLVLEYLPAGTLHSRIKGCMLSLEDCIVYARQIAAGLAYAHRRGIIHRDVKPGNAMFSEQGDLKLVDFGLAKLGGSMEMTTPGTLMGTVSYMAPEQARGEAVHFSVDIYSTGVMLYEFAAGRVPFRAERAEIVIHQILTAEPPPLQDLRPGLPEAYYKIVAHALEKDSDKRYSTMNHLLEDLEAIAAEEGLERVKRAALSSHDQTTQTLIRPRPERASKPGPVGRLIKRVGRRNAILGGLLVMVLAMAAPLYERWQRWGRPVPVNRQILVLPFANIGGDTDSPAFSEGMMETLTAMLSQLERFQSSLWVVPASEVRSSKINNVGEARRRFSVNLVITGSVQRTDTEVRVIANLVDAINVRQLGSRILTVRRDEARLQTALLSAVLELLELEMRPQINQILNASNTQNASAYDLYVQGQGYLGNLQGRKEIEKAIVAFEQAVRRDPKYTLAYAALAEAYLGKHRLDKGEAQWLAKADAASSKAAALNRGLPQVHLALGLVQVATGRNEEAAKEFQEAVALDPSSVEGYRQLASAYTKLGRIQDAVATFQKAIRLKPGYWPNYHSLGVFYWQQGKYAQAEEPFQLVVKLAPENPSGYKSLGALYHMMDRYDDAVAALRKSLELEPSATAYTNLGTIYFFRGHYAQAVEMFEKAVQERGHDPIKLGNLADGYWQVPGGKEKALEHYRKAVQYGESLLLIDPSDSALRASLAVYLSKLGQGLKARQYIGQALKHAPYEVGILYRAARVYELTGARPEALQYLGEAIRRGYSTGEVHHDPDLAALRQDPRFRNLITGAAKR